MAWNGSGVFSRLYNWVNDRDAGTKILATKMDAEMDGFTTGINNCLTKDGQNSPTTDLDMDGNKHTDVGNGSARTHYSAVGQVQDGAFRYAAVSGTDTYTMTLSPAITAYAAGQVFYGLVTNANTGASTLNVNSVGAASITDMEGNALVGGEIVAGSFCAFGHDGTDFVLLSAIPDASATVAGRVELATTAEIDTGTDTTRAVTPAGLVHVIDGSSTQKIQTAAFDTATPWELVEEKLAISGTANIEFTSIGSYDEYLLTFENLSVVAASPTIAWQTGNSGAFDTSGYAYAENGGTSTTSASSVVIDTLTSNAEEISGSIFIQNAGSTGRCTAIIEYINYASSDIAGSGSVKGVHYAETAARDRFRLLVSSSTFDQGNARLYGRTAVV